MKQHRPHSFRAGDFAAVGIVLLLSALSFFLFYFHDKRTVSDTVSVYQNGTLLYTYNLSENRTFTVSGDYENTVVIENGSVYISSSNCPGNDCVHMGKIHSSGQSLICLPNRLEIRLGGPDDEVDIISR